MSTPDTTILDRISIIVDDCCDGNDSKFGSRIGKSRSYMGFLRNKEDPNPSYDVLKAICDNFEVREEWLISGVGKKYKYPKHEYGGGVDVEDTVNEVEDKINQYEAKVAESGVDDAHRDLLLSYIEENVESLSKTLKMLRAQLLSDSQ